MQSTSGRSESPKRKRERKLRETVAQASGCLDDLSTGQRRVLTLRAGIGAGPPRSRGSVARRLNVSVRRVARLERTGLRRLRSLAGNGGCAPPAGMVASATTAPSTLAAAIEPAAGERSGSGRGNDDSREPESTPSGERSSGGGVAGISETNRPAEGAINITIPLILLVLLVAAIPLARILRRHATPVPAGAAPVDEPARPVWVPWWRSTMTGPSWNEKPPPSREESWAESPSKEPEPEHEPWTGPRAKRPVR